MKEPGWILLKLKPTSIKCTNIVVKQKRKKKDRVVCQCFKAPEECKLELQLLYICKTLDLPTVDPSFPISHSCLLLPPPLSLPQCTVMLCTLICMWLWLIRSGWQQQQDRGALACCHTSKADLSAKNTLCNLFRGALSSSAGLMGC